MWRRISQINPFPSNLLFVIKATVMKTKAGQNIQRSNLTIAAKRSKKLSATTLNIPENLIKRCTLLLNGIVNIKIQYIKEGSMKE